MEAAQAQPDPCFESSGGSSLSLRQRISLLIPLGYFLWYIKGRAARLALEVQVKAGTLLPWRPRVEVFKTAALFHQHDPKERLGRVG